MLNRILSGPERKRATANNTVLHLLATIQRPSNSPEELLALRAQLTAAIAYRNSLKG